MTIKHLGGIFGRNPTFNDVTIDGGIYFEDGQSGNYLDDYEEGTWTPRISGQSSGGTGTYTSQSGRYRKIGSMVQAYFQVGISAHTGSGIIDIEGFPFSSANDSLAQIGTAATLDMTFTADGTPIIRMSANSAKAQLQTVSSGSNWTSQSLATDTVFTIYGSISYKTS